jgi:hypothetical protein
MLLPRLPTSHNVQFLLACRTLFRKLHLHTQGFFDFFCRRSHFVPHSEAKFIGNSVLCGFVTTERLPGSDGKVHLGQSVIYGCRRYTLNIILNSFQDGKVPSQVYVLLQLVDAERKTEKYSVRHAVLCCYSHDDADELDVTHYLQATRSQSQTPTHLGFGTPELFK